MQEFVVLSNVVGVGSVAVGGGRTGKGNVLVNRAKLTRVTVNPKLLDCEGVVDGWFILWGRMDAWPVEPSSNDSMARARCVWPFKWSAIEVVSVVVSVLFVGVAFVRVFVNGTTIFNA